MSIVGENGHWLGTTPSDWQRTRIRNVARLSPTYSEVPPSTDEYLRSSANGVTFGERFT